MKHKLNIFYRLSSRNPCKHIYTCANKTSLVLYNTKKYPVLHVDSKQLIFNLQFTSVGSKPSFWEARPSFLIRWAKPSRAFFRKGKSSQAELFAFKTKPNRAFGFPKLSYFWLFSVDFFKEFNFLVEKTHFYWCLQDYTLKNWQKCWKSAHFLFFKVTRFFKW